MHNRLLFSIDGAMHSDEIYLKRFRFEWMAGVEGRDAEW
jgi:hypothetical protein